MSVLYLGNFKLEGAGQSQNKVLHSCHQFHFVVELYLTIQVRMGRSGQTWLSVHV